MLGLARKFSVAALLEKWQVSGPNAAIILNSYSRLEADFCRRGAFSAPMKLSVIYQECNPDLFKALSRPQCKDVHRVLY